MDHWSSFRSSQGEIQWQGFSDQRQGVKEGPHTTRHRTQTHLDDEPPSSTRVGGFRCGFNLSQHTHHRVKKTHCRRRLTIQGKRSGHSSLSQLYGLRVSPRSWQICLTQVLKRKRFSLMMSYSCFHWQIQQAQSISGHGVC